MAIIRIQPSVLILLVVQFDIVGRSDAHQLVSLIHLLAQGLEYGLCLLRILYNRAGHLILLIRSGRKYRKIMLQQFGIRIELHHLGIDEHELQLRWMPGIQQGCDNDIQTDRLALLGGPRHKEMWSLSKVEDLDILRNRIAYRHRQLELVLPESIIIQA